MTLLLVVDDDARAAHRLAQMLREDGWQVEVAIDGAAAIARLSRSPLPAILVTDLQLPNADGGAVSKYARARAPAMPIILVTGHPHLARKMGDDLTPSPVVLTKPLSYEELTATLKSMQPSSP